MEPKIQRSQRRSNSNMKRSSSSNSESQTHVDSPHSPLRFHSPLRSEQGDPPETPPYASPEGSPEKPRDNSKAIVVVDKCTQYSPLRSPIPAPQKQPETVPVAKSPPTTVVLNRSMREEMPPGMMKVGPVSGGGDGGGEGRPRVLSSILRRSRSDEMMKLAGLGFRISEVVLCLISFSVMAADKTQGWSGDSYDRYKEYSNMVNDPLLFGTLLSAFSTLMKINYRYCLSVNVIAFVYSIFQAYDLTYNLMTGKHVIRHYFRRQFDFFMDQILAYLLISASSSAATRVDDWQSNWGKDEFTEMASASVSMAFLAFIAFAISSLISGYNLCTLDST